MHLSPCPRMLIFVTPPVLKVVHSNVNTTCKVNCLWNSRVKPHQTDRVTSTTKLLFVRLSLNPRVVVLPEDGKRSEHSACAMSQLSPHTIIQLICNPPSLSPVSPIFSARCAAQAGRFQASSNGIESTAAGNDHHPHLTYGRDARNMILTRLELFSEPIFEDI